MDDKEGIGLPSSLVDEAIGSMNTDSQMASNNPIASPDLPQEVNEESKNDFQEIDIRDPYRGSNVDRPSAIDNGQFGSMNSGLLGDTMGSTIPVMEQPVLAEQVGQIDYIKWFSELTNKDVPSAGGKGASLGEMFSSKFPVPPGYVITAQAYDYYLKNSGLKEKIAEIIDAVDVDDTGALNEASKNVRQLIENGSMPEDLKDEILESYKILSSEDLGDVSSGVSSDALSILKNSQEPIFVSVRSSATTEDLADASFAGQQESFLNVKGEASLVEHVKRCFSSLYTPRAIFYRKKKGFSGALIAVVVQKMVDSEKSGVVFSRDPVQQEDNIAMEAVFGLGEGIVSGKIHPDNYLVDRDLEIQNIRVANKKIAIVRTSSGTNEIVKLSEEKSNSQVMSRAEIKEVADFALKLEEHYDKPQDIEFAIEAGEVYIIQSRPITTLASKKQGKELEGNIIVEGLAASPGVGVGTVRIVKKMEDLVSIKKGDVMVTEMTNPDMVVSMQKSVAIVTDEGGMTSHAAIVSREMGIPAIVGCSDATIKLKDGMRVTVDGFNGKVFEGEVAETTMAEIKPVIETSRVKMKVIVDLPDYAERAAKSGIDAVGLTRLEGMIASMGKHPLWYEKQGKLEDYSKILQDGLSKIAKPFKSVWVRASDIRTDEFASLEGAPEREINPMLGFHGVRFSVKHPQILKAEIAAIREVAEHNPEKKIGLMFPQIISMEEVLEVKKYFDEFRTDNMEFGVMIETPASVQIIEDICDHVDFISFGTNDLTQFTLAVDRGEDMVQHLYNELHPAIFSQIGHVIDVCNKKNVVSSICGQAGSKPEMAEFLFKKGIKSISVNADAAYDISEVLSKLEKEVVEEPVQAVEDISNVQVEEPVVGENVQESFVEKPKQEEWNNKAQLAVAVEGPVVEANPAVQEPVVDPIVEVSSNEGELSAEERKALKKKKKWEKFKKWKEKKKAERAAKRKLAEEQKENVEVKEDAVEQSDSEDHGWGKQGEVALPDPQPVAIEESTPEEKAVETERQEVIDEVKQDEQQFNQEVKEENPYEDNLLNPETIEVSAKEGSFDNSTKSSQDSFVDNVDESKIDDAVAKVDDTSHIQEVAQEIAEDVKEDNEEAIEERHEAKDRIEVEIASPEELKEEAEIESVEEEVERYKNDDVEEKTVNQYLHQDDTVIVEPQEETPLEKKMDEEIQEVIGDEEVQEEQKEASLEQPSPYSEDNFDVEEEGNEDNGEDSENTEENSDYDAETGSMSGEIEDIGVYNPDDAESNTEEKSKYNYNFEDWE